MAYCKGCNRKAECKAKGKCLGPKKVKKMSVGGASLKTPPKDAKGLKKLPTPVRNKMGFLKKGGMAKKGSK